MEKNKITFDKARLFRENIYVLKIIFLKIVAYVTWNNLSMKDISLWTIIYV